MDVLDILVQSRRNTAAAKRFMRKLFKQWGLPRVMVTDKLRSYSAAKAKIAPGLEHRRHKGINNAAEASHRHTRRREKIMGRFKSPDTPSGFCRSTTRPPLSSAHAVIASPPVLTAMPDGTHSTYGRTTRPNSRHKQLQADTSASRSNNLTIPLVVHLENRRVETGKIGVTRPGLAVVGFDGQQDVTLEIRVALHLSVFRSVPAAARRRCAAGGWRA